MRNISCTFAIATRILARCLFSKAITHPFYRDGEACTTILVEMLIRRTTAQQGCYDIRGSGRKDMVGTAEILIANLSRNLRTRHRPAVPAAD